MATRSFNKFGRPPVCGYFEITNGICEATYVPPPIRDIPMETYTGGLQPIPNTHAPINTPVITNVPINTATITPVVTQNPAGTTVIPLETQQTNIIEVLKNNPLLVIAITGVLVLVLKK